MNPADIGVIFDMDGVLIDSADAHFESWRRLAAENGRTVSRQLFESTFGRVNRDIIPVIFGPVAEDRLLALAARKEELFRESIRREPPLAAGAADLLRDLHRRGVRLAIGSSGPPENIAAVVEALHAGDLFTTVVNGDMVHRGKPDPEVFQLAAAGLNLPAARCVVIEDAPVGVQAAHAAGTRAVAITLYHPAHAFPSPDLTVSRLAELSADRLIELVRTGEEP